MRAFLLVISTVLFHGCGTTDSQLLEQGHTASFVQGFHDGRHSGMQVAGNEFEHYIRDHDRFESDQEYENGWIEGEAEGIRLQQRAMEVGNIAAGAYQGHQIGKEVDKQTDPDSAARKAVRNVDTSGLDSLSE